MKDKFIEHVCSLLDDAEVAEIARMALTRVPEAFWTAPASSSGKYHPEYALGKGGLMRHTPGVYSRGS